MKSSVIMKRLVCYLRPQIWLRLHSVGWHLTTVLLKWWKTIIVFPDFVGTGHLPVLQQIMLWCLSSFGNLHHFQITDFL